VKGFKVNEVTRYSDYKKFNVESVASIGKPKSEADAATGTTSDAPRPSPNEAQRYGGIGCGAGWAGASRPALAVDFNHNKTFESIKLRPSKSRNPTPAGPGEVHTKSCSVVARSCIKVWYDYG